MPSGGKTDSAGAKSSQMIIPYRCGSFKNRFRPRRRSITKLPAERHTAAGAQAFPYIGEGVESNFQRKLLSTDEVGLSLCAKVPAERHAAAGSVFYDLPRAHEIRETPQAFPSAEHSMPSMCVIRINIFLHKSLFFARQAGSYFEKPPHLDAAQKKHQFCPFLSFCA